MPLRCHAMRDIAMPLFTISIVFARLSLDSAVARAYALMRGRRTAAAPRKDTFTMIARAAVRYYARALCARAL